MDGLTREPVMDLIDMYREAWRRAWLGAIPCLWCGGHHEYSPSECMDFDEMPGRLQPGLVARLALHGWCA